MSGTAKIAAVVLAAGASRRLGRPKQIVALGGETLVERAVRVAMEAELAPVIVVVKAVVQPEGDFGRSLQQRGCMIVVNEQAEEGMAASIRRGVQMAGMLKAEGVVLMACDQVALRPEHLRALCEQPESAAGSGYAGKVGIPAYFPAASFAGLMELRGDVGAREMLLGQRVVMDEALVLDVDTEADVERANAEFGGFRG